MALHEGEPNGFDAASRASESYKLKAAECQDRAASAADPATRVNFLELAEYWSDMARDAESLDQIRPHA